MRLRTDRRLAQSAVAHNKTPPSCATRLHHGGPGLRLEGKWLQPRQALACGAAARLSSPKLEHPRGPPAVQSLSLPKPRRIARRQNTPMPEPSEPQLEATAPLACWLEMLAQGEASSAKQVCTRSKPSTIDASLRSTLVSWLRIRSD